MSLDRAAAADLATSTDPQRLRSMFAAFVTGVTVVAVGGDHPHGMTANSFTSVSLDPPLVLICIDHDARMHHAILRAEAFAISVLATGQGGVARYFASRRRPLGMAQFATVDWFPGSQTGAPLIGGALAWLECRLWGSYDGGDHSIFLGRLVSTTRREGEPLAFFGGQFRQLAREGLG